MTLRDAIKILYSEATSEDRNHPLKQIDMARDKLINFVELLEKENFINEQTNS